MFNAPAALRKLLKEDSPFIRMAVSDPMMGRIAQQTGFTSASMSGYTLGARTCVPEPLHDLTFVAQEARQIQKSITIPITVDVGAGFGEAIQVWQTTRELENVGVGGIQMEDQVFPKRAHYHRDYVEHTISSDHMREKIAAFMEARQDPNFVLIARTDAMKTDGYDEAVRRGNAYAEAGADIIMVFPNSLEETKRAPQDIKAPCAYVVSHGNRVGRPVPRVDELMDMGYKMISYAVLGSLVTYRSLTKVFGDLYRTGDAGQPLEDMIAARKEIEDMLGLPHLYEMEEKTTESREYVRV